MPLPEAVQGTIRSRFVAAMAAPDKLYKSGPIVQLYPCVNRLVGAVTDYFSYKNNLSGLQFVFLTKLFPCHAQRRGMLF